MGFTTHPLHGCRPQRATPLADCACVDATQSNTSVRVRSCAKSSWGRGREGFSGCVRMPSGTSCFFFSSTFLSTCTRTVLSISSNVATSCHKTIRSASACEIFSRGISAPPFLPLRCASQP